MAQKQKTKQRAQFTVILRGHGAFMELPLAYKPVVKPQTGNNQPK